MGLFKKKKQPERAPEPEKRSPLDEMDPTIRPGGVFMVQLLMKEKCEMPSLQRMTEVLERRIGRVEAAEPQEKTAEAMNGLALFAAMDHIAKFSNGQGPVQVSIMPCDTFHPETIDEMKREIDRRYSRIYDRIFEICYPMQFVGPSWRKKAANQRFREMEALLGGDEEVPRNGG